MHAPACDEVQVQVKSAVNDDPQQQCRHECQQVGHRLVSAVAEHLHRRLRGRHRTLVRTAVGTTRVLPHARVAVSTRIVSRGVPRVPRPTTACETVKGAQPGTIPSCRPAARVRRTRRKHSCRVWRIGSPPADREDQVK